jgi:4-diphosphocytidyl-2-C-methyl-D-erythritol kinase
LPDTVIAHAPAKINLVLEVEPLATGEEKHRLASLFCTTTLTDTLVFDFAPGREPFNAQVTVESVGFDTSFVNPNNNTLIKTVECFKREYGFGFLTPGTLKVELIKSIPTRAGLGGGSSDAAALLRMLCWLAELEPLSERSLKVARAVGADVPFFLHAPKTGLCARMGGHGDKFIEAVPKPRLHLCLTKPADGVATRRAFAAFEEEDHAAQLEHAGATLRLAQALKEGQGLRAIAALCTNNLEPVATALLPEIAGIQKMLRACAGVLGVTMSGSGSALFAICENAEAAQACMQYCASQGLWAVAVES